MSEEFFTHLFDGLMVTVGAVVGIFAWAVARTRLLQRRGRRLGLIDSTVGRWRVRVEVRDGAGYREAEETILVGPAAVEPRRIPVTGVRGARWVRDPQRHFAGRLEDALHLALEGGEGVVVPGSADGFGDLLALLERHRILQEINLVARR